MINILIGAPGGGKSYEAVCYHVLPALKRGRKVITNLPLLLPAFEALDDEYPGLIELRTKTLAEVPEVESFESSGGLMGLISQARAAKFDARPFANSEDFASDWKGSEGQGPLYIVDECHFVMPRGGTSRAVEEWFSMHRHFNADVLLITQSSGKISAAIKDLIQVCYKVRKAIAFGKTDSYIRKVLDGVGGGEVSVSERKYKPQIFKLYRSHTQGSAVVEADADDVKPFIVKFRWFTRAILLAGVLACGAVWWSATHSDKPVVRAPSLPAGLPAAVTQNLPVAVTAMLPKAAASAPLDDDPEPYASKTLHLTGHAKMGNRSVYTFAVSQQGLVVNNITDSDLVKSGYVWRGVTDCSGSLFWHGKAQAVTCDVPQISMGSVAPKSTPS